MTAPVMKQKLTQINGPDLRRFVLHSALLRLIDPVRGPPTRTLLDEDPEGDDSSGPQLKLKFLDSFALICSTSSIGGETASAVCLEQHGSAKTVLRVARNRGFTPDVLASLEQVLELLSLVARKEKSPTQAESAILQVVVELDRDRIIFIAKRAAKAIEDFLQESKPKLLAPQVHAGGWARSGLRPWLEKGPFTGADPETWSSATVEMLITWASQARWAYHEQLQGLLGRDHPSQPPWLDSLHKIARYHAAVKSMAKLAAKRPEVFMDIQIQVVNAPDLRPFSLPQEKAPVLAALKTLCGEEAGTIMGNLEVRLGTQDVEACVRKACRLKLTLHAEMQLVVFYEGRPDLVPQMPFIGTSKKACFLCYEYLRRHPLGLRVSACHQKIYQTWMPPPYYPSPTQYKSKTFVALSRRIEQLTKQEVKAPPTTPLRQKNQDSTAGSSLTKTATTPTGLESRRGYSALDNNLSEDSE